MQVFVLVSLMILIALGSNLSSHAGTSEETLQAVLATLEHKNILPVRVSRFYLTPAWPNPNDPTYVNAVALVTTQLDPSRLMTELHETEEQFGRKRGARNAPRTVDLDLLDYDGRIVSGPPVLPHPRLETRGFVLVPLADVAPDWKHPVSGRSVAELIAELPEAERNLPRLT
jgi:2-amino-4-hydroxy-6-hydroxymethyldihydropteridine diphosphokinase